MIDGCGRTIDYIRISVTDRCNLRCIYCMPEEGVSLVQHREILDFDEILRLAGIFSKIGICKIKLTGGEPLIRRNIGALAGRLKRIPGIEQVTLTTNGVLLADQMDQLAQAGIDGINISLDTLDPDTFARITRRAELDRVLEGLAKAMEYPDIPLKINCVPMGDHGQDLTAMAAFAKKYPIHVRFIEMMPIGAGKLFRGKTEEEILSELTDRFGPYEICRETEGNGPAHYYRFPDFKGKIGFISAISHKFCGTCNRVRLTSQGYLKTCLQYDMGTDLRKIMRNGGDDAELTTAVRAAILRKPEGHQFDRALVEHGEDHFMPQIGG